MKLTGYTYFQSFYWVISNMDITISGHPYDSTSEIINCDDEEDCAAGSGSGLGPPSIVIGNGDDSSYETSITGNEESEEFSYPKGSESGKCMSLPLIGL